MNNSADSGLGLFLYYCLTNVKQFLSLFFAQASTSKSLSRVQQRKLAGGNGTKHSTTGRMPTKGSVRHRLHPGLLSSQDRATAHYGAVTGLKLTEDGMYLLSAGWLCLNKPAISSHT